MTDSLTEPTYEVEEILKARAIPEKKGMPVHTEYLVKWKDYGSEFNTWEPENNFIEKRCIREFWRDHDPSNSTLLAQTRLLDEKHKITHPRQGTKEYNGTLVSKNTEAKEQEGIQTPARTNRRSARNNKQELVSMNKESRVKFRKRGC